MRRTGGNTPSIQSPIADLEDTGTEKMSFAEVPNQRLLDRGER